MNDSAKMTREEYIRQYRQANKQRIAENRRKYYETHREQVKEKSRQYYEDHKDEIKLRNAIEKDKKAVESIGKIKMNLDNMQEKQERDMNKYETPEVPCRAIRDEIKRYELRKKIEKDMKDIQYMKHELEKIKKAEELKK